MYSNICIKKLLKKLYIQIALEIQEKAHLQLHFLAKHVQCHLNKIMQNPLTFKNLPLKTQAQPSVLAFTRVIESARRCRTASVQCNHGIST